MCLGLLIVADDGATENQTLNAATICDAELVLYKQELRLKLKKDNGTLN